MSSIEWETPQDFFSNLNEEFGFTLDVCATWKNTKVKNFFCISDNALTKEWNGVCWMNPPYNKDIGSWVGKAYRTAQRGHTVVCLLQARSSDTKWFHAFVMRSSEIRFIKDRLSFGLDGKFSRANISSMIVVFRPYCEGYPKISAINKHGKPLK